MSNFEVKYFCGCTGTSLDGGRTYSSELDHDCVVVTLKRALEEAEVHLRGDCPDAETAIVRSYWRGKKSLALDLLTQLQR